MKTDHLIIRLVAESLLALSDRYFIDLTIEFTLIYWMILHLTAVVAKSTIFFIL